MQAVRALRVGGAPGRAPGDAPSRTGQPSEAPAATLLVAFCEADGPVQLPHPRSPSVRHTGTVGPPSSASGLSRDCARAPGTSKAPCDLGPASPSLCLLVGRQQGLRTNPKDKPTEEKGP